MMVHTTQLGAGHQVRESVSAFGTDQEMQHLSDSGDTSQGRPNKSSAGQNTALLPKSSGCRSPATRQVSAEHPSTSKAASAPSLKVNPIDQHWNLISVPKRIDYSIPKAQQALLSSEEDCLVPPRDPGASTPTARLPLLDLNQFTDYVEQSIGHEDGTSTKLESPHQSCPSESSEALDNTSDISDDQSEVYPSTFEWPPSSPPVEHSKYELPPDSSLEELWVLIKDQGESEVAAQLQNASESDSEIEMETPIALDPQPVMMGINRQGSEQLGNADDTLFTSRSPSFRTDSYNSSSYLASMANQKSKRKAGDDSAPSPPKKRARSQPHRHQVFHDEDVEEEQISRTIIAAESSLSCPVGYERTPTPKRSSSSGGYEKFPSPGRYSPPTPGIYGRSPILERSLCPGGCASPKYASPGYASPRYASPGYASPRGYEKTPGLERAPSPEGTITPKRSRAFGSSSDPETTSNLEPNSDPEDSEWRERFLQSKILLKDFPVIEVPQAQEEPASVRDVIQKEPDIETSISKHSPLNRKDTKPHKAWAMYQCFQKEYPEYHGSRRHFMNMLFKIETLVAAKKMEDQSVWDDFLIRNTLDYASYLDACKVGGDDPIPYNVYYHSKVESPIYLKGILGSWFEGSAFMNSPTGSPSKVTDACEKRAAGISPRLVKALEAVKSALSAEEAEGVAKEVAMEEVAKETIAKEKAATKSQGKRALSDPFKAFLKPKPARKAKNRGRKRKTT